MCLCLFAVLTALHACLQSAPFSMTGQMPLVVIYGLWSVIIHEHSIITSKYQNDETLHFLYQKLTPTAVLYLSKFCVTLLL